MNALRLRPRRCDRAREAVSLRVDGKLSEFEDALLDAHLDRCAACSAFAHDVAGMTTTLRTAPLERLDHPVVISRPPRSPFRVVQVAAAAAVIVVAAGIGSTLSLLRSGEPVVRASGDAKALVSVDADDVRAQRELRRASLVPHPWLNFTLRRGRAAL